LAALSAQYAVPSFEDLARLNPFHNLLPNIVKKLEIIAANFDKNQTQTVELLSAICFQSSIGYVMPTQILNAVEKVLRKVNCWSQYKIARSASRYGHHFMAGKIYQKLSKHVSLEKYHYYMVSLLQISKAECILNYGFEYESLLADYTCLEDKNSQTMEVSLTERLDKAINLYSMALATLKASSSPQHPLTFQAELIRLRGLHLEALFNVVIACNTQQVW
jgi:integrator complex subunit 7